MSVLVKLPSELFAHVVSEWMVTTELTMLDTACCSSTVRPALLKEMSLLPPLLNVTPDKDDTKPKKNSYMISMYKWIFARGIKLQRYVIDKAQFKGGKLLYSINYEHVTG